MMRILTPVRCLAAAGALLAVSATAASAGETRGFAISWFQPAYYVGDDDCPNGVSKERDWKALFAAQGKTPEQIDFFAKQSALGRLGQPVEIAEVITFLAGDAGRWISGQNIRANGGLA